MAKSKISVKVKKPKPGKKPSAGASAEVWARYTEKEKMKLQNYMKKVKEAESNARKKEAAKTQAEKLRNVLRGL